MNQAGSLGVKWENPDCKSLSGFIPKLCSKNSSANIHQGLVYIGGHLQTAAKIQPQCFTDKADELTSLKSAKPKGPQQLLNYRY